MQGQQTVISNKKVNKTDTQTDRQTDRQIDKKKTDLRASQMSSDSLDHVQRHPS